MYVTINAYLLTYLYEFHIKENTKEQQGCPLTTYYLLVTIIFFDAMIDGYNC